MFRSARPKVFWHLGLVLGVVLFGLAFTPKLAIPDDDLADQTTYSLQRGTPAAIPNFVDLTAGCNWGGVGGQVFDQNGAPVAGLLIKISGTLDGQQVLQYLYTGSSQHFGPGGFDLKLANRPVSSQTLRLQLLDAAGAPLSLPFGLSTYGTCDKNLLVVNLMVISVDNPIYLPQIPR
jgi:hypothetical protein